MRFIGLSGLFRTLRIPLEISVEGHVLEIGGLDSRSGLKTGDFRLPIFSTLNCFLAVTRRAQLQESDRSVNLFQKPEPRRLSQWFWQHRFGLMAFLIPLVVRAIPEIIAGPYPIGWDTIAFYVPSTLDWAAGKDGLLFMIGEAPLLYMISVPVYLISRVDPVWIFKVLGPMLYGCMIFALFRFLRLELYWTDRLAFTGSVLTSLYFVTLRISWDLFRNELGLIFVLLSLPFLTKPPDRRSSLILAGLVVLAVASNQFTGVISLILVGTRALAALRNSRKKFFDFLEITAPGIALFGLMVYAEFASTGSSFPRQPPSATLGGLDSTFVLVWAYLPVAPLAFLGMWKMRNRDLLAWTGLCVVASLVTSVPGWGLVSLSYRWVILLSVPTLVFAIQGAFTLSRAASNHQRIFVVLGRNSLRLFGIALVLLAGLYVFLPAQQAFPYYGVYPALVPTSMTQNTVPLSDMSSLVQALDWAAVNMRPGMALIAGATVYGWARDYFPFQNRIVDYGYGTPTQGVQMATSAGFSSVIMIWWAYGQGWYGQTIIPSNLRPAHQEGTIEVYAST